MLKKTHKTALALGAGAALAALVAVAHAQPRLPAEQPPAAPAAAPAVSFARVAATIEAAGYRIREMDRDNGGFEIEATARDGRRVELDVDAGGQIVRERHDD